MTFLQAVNDVLARLRESSVASVTTNFYSTLIGKYINDSKTQVEDSWDWDALRTVISVNTASGTSNYTVAGSGLKQKNVVVNCITSGSQHRLINKPIQWILDQQDLTTQTNGQPAYYAWHGNDGTDSKVELFPTPDSTLTLKFRMYVPQALLSSDATTITVNYEAVVMGAYARALVERGEDGGLNSSEAYGLFKGIIADQIAIESSRYVENDSWEAV